MARITRVVDSWFPHCIAQRGNRRQESPWIITSPRFIAPCTAGCYFLGANADSNNAIAESNEDNNTASVPLRVADSLKIYTRSLPRGQVGVPYSAGLAVNGGITPWTWTLDGGALPSGLALTPEGVIFGTPTTPGTFQFTVRVTDGPEGGPCARQTTTQRFTITIK
jgi:hypothetical protein